MLWIDRRKCLLLTHAGTLFPAFVADVRKADLVPLGALVAERAATALNDERPPDDILGVLDPPAPEWRAPPAAGS